MTITVSSVTYAMKARKILMRRGIGSELIKETKKLTGCTAALKINDSDLFESARLLREAGIDYSVLEEK